MITSSPELSIIVPVLNDALELQGLLINLAEQRGVSFEVLLCDGGSTDDITELAAIWMAQSPLTLRLIATPRGRGLQMNAGAAVATGAILLFLHADSRFSAHDALRSGLQAYTSAQPCPSTHCAARFRLRFRRSDSHPSLAYFYHEAKSRLKRGDCIRGDQGYLIDRRTFEQLGRFDGSLPFLEDVRLATLVAEKGAWLLLPAEISTSARRFEQEGFYERQVANVIIVNAIVTGWNELLSALPGLYRCNRTSGRLLLFPLLDGIRTMINTHNHAWRTAFWQATGRHVASNAWQLFFWLDVHRAFGSGQGPDDVLPVWLNRYEERLKPLFESRPAARLAEGLTRLWLWWLLRATNNVADLTKTS